MKLTPSQVKNLMRRGLRFLVDPEPDASSKQAVWAYFENSCAYCGTAVASGSGDVDHLISAALDGANNIANRVLSCKPCNAKEKRDRDWTEFLRAKADSDNVFAQRKTKIDNWVEQNGGHPKLSTELAAVLEEEMKRVTQAFDEACQRIRNAKLSSGT